MISFKLEFYDANGIIKAGGVSSVTMTAAPSSVFDVTNTNTSGAVTIALSMDNQTANQVLASPSSGGAAAPAFRSLVDGDIPTALAGHTITGGTIDNTPIGTTTRALGYFSALREYIGGFAAIFTHANTSDRTYTFQDSSDTIVGRDTTDTLTNKTLTTPTIASFTNAQHNHTNAAGGGTLTSAAVSDFNEAVDDEVNALLLVTAGLAKNYDDAGNALTLYNTAPVAQGRLTLTSATPVMTPPVTAATTLYYAEYVGNLITLYDGTRSRDYTFSNISLSLSGFTADSNYDIYAYQSSGTVTLEAQIWTNNTTPASSKVYQDGYLVKSGDVTRRFLGSIRITGSTGQCQFGNQKFYVSNLYNRIAFETSIIDTADTWTYATATWRAWDNSTANRIEFVRCIDEDIVFLEFIPMATGAAAVNAAAGINLDATTGTPTIVNSFTQGSGVYSPLVALYNKRPGIGYHYLQLMEFATGATATFVGDLGTTYIQSSARGYILA